MYVCICKGITDTQIRTAVEDGATSLRVLCNTLGVASQCGQCHVLANKIIRQTLLDTDNEQLCTVNQTIPPRAPSDNGNAFNNQSYYNSFLPIK